MNPLLPSLNTSAVENDSAIKFSQQDSTKSDDSQPSFKDTFERQSKTKKTSTTTNNSAADNAPRRDDIQASRNAKEAESVEHDPSTASNTEDASAHGTSAHGTSDQDNRASATSNGDANPGSANNAETHTDAYSGIPVDAPLLVNENFVGPVLPVSADNETVAKNSAADIMASALNVDAEIVQPLGQAPLETRPALAGLAGALRGLERAVKGGDNAETVVKNASITPKLATLISENSAVKAATVNALSGDTLDASDEAGRSFRRSVEQFVATRLSGDGSKGPLTGGESGKNPAPVFVANNVSGNLAANSQNPLAMVGKGAGLMRDTLASFAEQGDSGSRSTSAPLQSGLGLAPGVSTTGLPLAAEARVQLPVSITFGQAGWANMVAERSAMMAAQSIKFAELKLDPPELGPLQVKVSVNQDQASVSFIVANAQVKEALDQSLVRLKEMLEEQGLDLVNVDVSDQESQDADADAESQASNGEVGDELAEEEQVSTQRVEINAGYGVDHYA